MLSIAFGPLAFPVAPLILLCTLAAATIVARRLTSSGDPARAESAVWTAAALGVATARAGHVLSHAEAYLASPWAMIDLRDGGWLAPAGFVAAAAWLAWWAWASPALRRRLGAAALTAMAVWTLGTLAVVVAGAPKALPAELVLTEHPSGRVVRLPEALAGGPAVVNLWASWCGPCRAEMPTLAAARLRDRDIRFLFVNQGESADVVRAFLEREGLDLDGVWLDPASALGPAVGSGGLPTTLFIDARGRTVDAHFGVLNQAALQARVQLLRRRD